MGYCGLIVGLGNPGRQYACTRHNLGFRVIEKFCERPLVTEQIAGRKSAQALLFRTCSGQSEWLLACPQTFMNLSGKSVSFLLRAYGLNPDQMLVVHDELDLACGTVRFKRGGGLAGHNGLRSIAEHIGSRDFFRLRLGIGRPEPGRNIADYVLSSFAPSEQQSVTEMLASAAHSLQDYMDSGFDLAVQALHGK